MKRNLYKLIKGIVILGLIAVVSPAWAQNDSGFYTVKGIVKDKSTKRTIEYATISVAGTNIGTITNTNGEFSIKIKNGISSKTLEITHLGYSNEKVSIKRGEDNKITVYLNPVPEMLDEITIHAVDPRFLVEQAIRKIPKNYLAESTILTGFYRETIKKRRSYVTVSEAVVDIYKTPYSNDVDGDMVRIHKGRKLISPKLTDTLVIKLLGGPNLSIYVDIVKNPDLLLSVNALPFYKFSMEQSVMIENRPHFVVAFEPQVILPYALHYGKLYIDKESLAFSRTEFSLSMDDRNKATEAILKKKPLSLRFKPEEVSFLVTYKMRDGLSHLNYIRSEVKFKCDWKRRLFSTNYTVVSETVITGTKETQGKAKMPSKFAFRETHSLSDKVVSFFDKDFWEDYNIIEPEESLENAVDRLKKEHTKN